VGEVRATGLTTREIEQNVTRLLGEKYLQNPQVTVLVAEYNSQRVTVEGAVKKPGVYPIQGELTLLQSIAVAQGLERTADTSVLVFRQRNGRRSAARFELDEIRSGRVKDPRLAAGDVVVVKTSVAKEAFDNVLKVVPLARVFVPL
jgi:polysaccharide export outer membrane protein